MRSLSGLNILNNPFFAKKYSENAFSDEELYGKDAWNSVGLWLEDLKQDLRARVESVGQVTWREGSLELSVAAKAGAGLVYNPTLLACRKALRAQWTNYERRIFAWLSCASNDDFGLPFRRFVRDDLRDRPVQRVVVSLSSQAYWWAIADAYLREKFHGEKIVSWITSAIFGRIYERAFEEELKLLEDARRALESEYAEAERERKNRLREQEKLSFWLRYASAIASGNAAVAKNRTRRINAVQKSVRRKHALGTTGYRSVVGSAVPRKRTNTKTAAWTRANWFNVKVRTSRQDFVVPGLEVSSRVVKHTVSRIFRRVSFVEFQGGDVRPSNRELREIAQRVAARKRADAKRKELLTKRERADQVKAQRDKRNPAAEFQSGSQTAVVVGAALGGALLLPIYRSVCKVLSVFHKTDVVMSTVQRITRSLLNALKEIALSVGRAVAEIPIIMFVFYMLHYIVPKDHMMVSVLVACLARIILPKTWTHIAKFFPVGEGRVQLQSGGDTVAKLLSTLLAFSAFKGRITPSRITEFVKRMSLLEKTAAGWETFFDWMVSAINGVYNYVRSIFGKEKVSLIRDSHQSVKRWFDKVAKLERDHDTAQAELTPEELDYMVSILREGYEYKLIYRGTDCERSVNACYAKAASLLNPYVSALNARQNLRVEPLACMLVGNPGIGKTVLMTYMAAALMKLSGFLKEGCDPEMAAEHVFQKGVTEFWNGYMGQFVLIMDDAFQQRPDQTDKDNEFMNIIRMVSSWAFPLNFADLASKGKIFFGSKVILGTTNVRSIWSDSSKVINAPEAVVRRINYPYELRLRDEYSKVCPQTTLKVLDFDKLKTEMEKCSTNSGLKGFPWYMWTVRKHDFLHGTTDTQDVELADMLEEMGSILRQRLDQHGVATKRLHAFVSGFDGAKEVADEQGGAFSRVRAEEPEGTPHTHGYITRSKRLSKLAIRVCGAQEDCSDVDMTAAEKDESGLFPPLEAGHIQAYINCAPSRFHSALRTARGPRLRAYILFALGVQAPKIDAALSKASTKELLALAKELVVDKERLDFIMMTFSAGNMEHDDERLIYEDGVWVVKSVPFLKRMFELTVGRVLRMPAFVQIGLAALAALVAVDVARAVVYGTLGRVLDLIKGLVGTTVGAVTGVAKKVAGVPRRKTSEPEEQSNTNGKIKDTTLHSGGRLTNNANIIENIYSNGYILSTVRANGARFVLGQLTFLVSDLCMIPAHFSETLREQVGTGEIPRDAQLMLTHNVNTKHSFSMSVAEFLSLPRVTHAHFDVEFVKIRQARAHRNVVGNFVRENELRHCRNVCARLEVCRAAPKADGELNMRSLSFIAERIGQGGEFIAGNKTIERHFFYRAPTEKGDCGAILCLYDSTAYSGRTCMGFHIAGSPWESRGYGAMVCQEMILEAKDKLDVMGDSFIEDLAKRGVESQCGDACPFEEMGSFLPIGKVSDPVNLNPKTSYYPTHYYVTHELGVCELLPAPLSAVWREGNLVYPMENAVKPYSSPLLYYDQDYLPQAVHTALLPLTQLTLHADRSIYSFDEAVLGVPQEKFRSIPRGTSAGYPYVREVRNGKKEFFGSGEVYDLTSVKCEELRVRVSEILEAAKKNERLAHVFMDFLKDELRPEHKVQAVATRLISSAPLDYVIAWRMYFGAFSAAFMKENTESGMAPGICVYSDWGKLARVVSTHGPDIFDGDFKAFDSSEQPGIHWLVLDYINDWYNDGPVNARVRTVLWADLVHSRHIGGRGTDQRYLYQWNKSLPSGHPFTTIINSIYSLVLLVSAYFVTLRKRDGFWQHVSPVTYGDDNIVNVVSELRDVYNQRTVSGVLFSEFGVRYTPGNKDDVWVEYTTIDKVTFLKRGFRQEGDYWACPLELDSFLRTHYWCKNRRLEQRILVDVLHNALEELSLHNDDTWDKYAPILARQLRDLGVVPRAPLSRRAFFEVSADES